MPYLILGIGVLIGLYGLYRFFTVANTRQIAALFGMALLLSVCAAMFYLAVTGKLAAALGLLAIIVPVLISWNRERKRDEAGKGPPDAEEQEESKDGRQARPDDDNPWWEQPRSSRAGAMSRKEAFEILGLSENASTEEISETYKKLIKKVHPDQQGSAWMAAKLNQARATLLEK